MALTDALDTIRSDAEVRLLLHEPLRDHTGFMCGGCAAALALPQTKDAFLRTVRTLRAKDAPYFILGKGKNVLAADEGYRGCVVKTEQALTDIRFDGGAVYCAAGVTLAKLCTVCRDRGLTGLEFAYGIPGTLGGAVFMNAGAYGGEMKDVVRAADVLGADGALRRVEGEALDFAYRHSFAQAAGDIILGAELLLVPGDPARIDARMEELLQRRRSKQPLEYPSCGSTFKRPDGDYASRLIELCGLKGRAVGGACVSEKHSGFIISRAGATSADILSLIEIVRKEVFDKTGYLLECEIRFLK
ncbi:MAG: UDP-N-acetylmuramate dehydrogenase [Oscillospiraceae bacterium]|nr:UDP-N-acetylmuramate dehydrogenase [Oscillospiraceae bacterium]